MSPAADADANHEEAGVVGREIEVSEIRLSKNNCAGDLGLEPVFERHNLTPSRGGLKAHR
jgi:hypothetical protein